MSLIRFCNLPFLSVDYSNVIDFADSDARRSYFENKVLLEYEGNIKYDNARTYINIALPHEQFINYDYLYFHNKNGKPFYYFIVGYEQVTKTNTNIFIQLDVWTTYLFNYKIKPSFVDRCHVDRWNGNIPTDNNEDEGLFYGEIIQSSKSKITDMKKAIVISSSVPIGFIDVDKPLGGNGGVGGDWENGVPSAKVLRILKQNEGLGVGGYDDGWGNMTIGYGVTKLSHPTEYNKLDALADKYYAGLITIAEYEAECAKVGYEIKVEHYGKPILSSCKALGVTTQYQFDALFWLAYNAGTGSVTGNNVVTRAIEGGDEVTIRQAWTTFKTLSGALTGLRTQQVDVFYNNYPATQGIGMWDRSHSYIGAFEGDGWLPAEQTEETGDYKGHLSVTNSYGSNWLVPVSGATVSSVYGYRTHPITGKRSFHYGVDLACSAGTPILATKTGTISQTGFDNSMGNYVYHDIGEYRVIYMHVKSIAVSTGDNVTRGTKIGEVGSTGSSTGNHLHWQIQTIEGGWDETTNPLPNKAKGVKV